MGYTIDIHIESIDIMIEPEDSIRVRSFFPAILKGKLPAYAQGEPSAYLFNKAKTTTDTDAPTYFQRWILKAIASNKPKLRTDTDAISVSQVDDLLVEPGFDISRMFDEIELRPEIMAEHEGESEYSLALSDANRMNERMTHINIEAAKIFLNETRDDLNDFAKNLLNDSMPGSYDTLIDILKPKNPALDEDEKIALARQKLAYYFIVAVRTCYCQKLQDINSAKHALVGLEIDIKKLSLEDIRGYREQKLTIFKSSDKNPAKYYIYGNTDGSSWQLREIPESLLVGIDFESETKLSSSRRYNLLHGHIKSDRLHTLSASQQAENDANEQSFINFYQRVISPIEVINRRPITSESFAFISSIEETEEEMYERVQVKYKFADNIKYFLEMQRNGIDDEESLQIVNQSIKALKIIGQDAQAIDDLKAEGVPITENMKSFLDKPITEEIKEATRIALHSVIVDLNLFNVKTVKNPDLQRMIIAELKKLDATSEAEIDYDLEFPLDSPIYLIMKLYSEYDNLTSLMDDLDVAGLSSDVVEEYKSLILKQIKQILIIEEGLRRTPVDEMDIQRAHTILSSPIAKLSMEYASVNKTGSAEAKISLIERLGVHVDKARQRSNLIGLNRHLEDLGADRYVNTIKAIGKYLHEFSDYSDSQVQNMSNNDLIFKTAAKLQELNDLPDSPSIKRRKLAREIQGALERIETWYENRNLVISARANLEILTAHLETLDESYNKGKLRVLISSAQASLSDDNVRFNDSRWVRNLLNNDIIKLANACEVTSGLDEDKIMAFDSALMDLGRNNSPKSLSFSFQAFKTLFSEKTRNIDPHDREASQHHAESPKNIKGM